MKQRILKKFPKMNYNYLLMKYLRLKIQFCKIQQGAFYNPNKKKAHKILKVEK